MKTLFVVPTIVTLSAILGFIHYKKMDRPGKIIICYVAATSIIELLGLYTALTRTPNHVLYNLFSPIQFFTLSLYYNFSIAFFRKKNIGTVAGLIMLTSCMLYFTFGEGNIFVFDSTIVAIGSFPLIAFSLTLFYGLLASDEIDIHLNPNFWINSLLLIFWSFTFFYWLIGFDLLMSDYVKYGWIFTLLWSINIITYSGFGIIFLLHNKLRSK